MSETQALQPIKANAVCDVCSKPAVGVRCGEAAGEGVAEGVRGDAGCVRGEEDAAGEALPDAAGEGAGCVRGEEDAAGEALPEAAGEGAGVAVTVVDGTVLTVALLLSGRHCQ